jgi:hypothetical protein
MSDKSIEELRAELRAAELREAAVRREAAAKIKPVYSYTLEPVTDHFDRALIDNCRIYKFSGNVLNDAELLAVGRRPFQLGSRYLFSEELVRFVMCTGGGSFNEAMHSNECWAELSAFVVEHPEGGDVTDIVRKYEKSQ